MTRERLVWRNVAAPDFMSASTMMSRAAGHLSDAFGGLADVGHGIHGARVERGSADAMLEAQRFTDSADWTRALQEGRITGSTNPMYVDRNAAQFLSGHRGQLLGHEQTMQNMEIQREQAARAAEAHAERTSGGGGGTGRGGGGRSGGGGRRSGSSENTSMDLANAEAALRIARAGGNPEEIEAAEQRLAALANVRGGAAGRSAVLTAADSQAERISTDRAQTVEAVDSVTSASTDDIFRRVGQSLSTGSAPEPETVSQTQGETGSRNSVSEPAQASAPVPIEPVASASVENVPAPVAVGPSPGAGIVEAARSDVSPGSEPVEPLIGASERGSAGQGVATPPGRVITAAAAPGVAPEVSEPQQMPVSITAAAGAGDTVPVTPAGGTPVPSNTVSEEPAPGSVVRDAAGTPAPEIPVTAEISQEFGIPEGFDLASLPRLASVLPEIQETLNQRLQQLETHRRDVEEEEIRHREATLLDRMNGTPPENIDLETSQNVIAANRGLLTTVGPVAQIAELQRQAGLIEGENDLNTLADNVAAQMQIDNPSASDRRRLRGEIQTLSRNLGITPNQAAAAIMASVNNEARTSDWNLGITTWRGNRGYNEDLARELASTYSANPINGAEITSVQRRELQRTIGEYRNVEERFETALRNYAGAEERYIRENRGRRNLTPFPQTEEGQRMAESIYRQQTNLMGFNLRDRLNDHLPSQFRHRGPQRREIPAPEMTRQQRNTRDFIMREMEREQRFQQRRNPTPFRGDERPYTADLNYMQASPDWQENLARRWSGRRQN